MGGSDVESGGSYADGSDGGGGAGESGAERDAQAASDAVDRAGAGRRRPEDGGGDLRHGPADAAGLGAQLADRLASIGIDDNERNLRNKVAGGNSPQGSCYNV